MTKYSDKINFQLKCNKKTSFSVQYKYGGLSISISGKDAYPTRYELPKEVELLQGSKNCSVSIFPSSKKQDGLLSVFEKDDYDEKQMFWEFVLDEASFEKLESNLINKGKDFLEKLIIQITVDKKDIAKLKKGTSPYSLKILDASVHFNSSKEDVDD